MDEETMEELRILVHKEAKRREFGVTACQGKHRFISFLEAQNTVRADLKHKVNIYHCVVCKTYHIGNNSGTRKKRLMARMRSEE